MSVSPATSRTFAFAGLAQAAARLRSVEPLAASLKLTSLNAQVLTARAGEEARGFDPLTHAITDMANTMATAVQEVGKVSRKLSKTSVKAYRLAEACRLVNNTVLRFPAESHQVMHLKAGVDEEFHTFALDVDSDIRMLTRLIAQLDRLTRQASFLDSNCRIEAAHVPSHQADFNNVADYLKDVTRNVMEILTASKLDLGDLVIANKRS